MFLIQTITFHEENEDQPGSPGARHHFLVVASSRGQMGAASAGIVPLTRASAEIISHMGLDETPIAAGSLEDAIGVAQDRLADLLPGLAPEAHRLPF